MRRMPSGCSRGSTSTLVVLDVMMPGEDGLRLDPALGERGGAPGPG
jgi:CheY-like chemotaxis protein